MDHGGMEMLKQVCVQLSQSMVFVEFLLLYSTLTNLPWGIYSTFVLEARHGFNKQVK